MRAYLPKKAQDELDLLSKPADTILESYNELNQSPEWQDKFMKAMGYTTLDEVNKLLNGHIRIDKGIAAQLEIAFAVPATFWLNRQRNYEQKLAMIFFPYKPYHGCTADGEYWNQQVRNEARAAFIDGIYFAYQNL